MQNENKEKKEIKKNNQKILNATKINLKSCKLIIYIVKLPKHLLNKHCPNNKSVIFLYKTKKDVNNFKYFE